MKHTFSLFLLVVLGIGAVNGLSSFFYARWDLTADKRYTLAPATQKLVQNLETDIHVEVLLSGEFPAAFERLENATRETLEEFRALSNGRLSFQFTDPSQAATEEKRQQNYQDLVDRGIAPTNLFANEKGKRTEKIIFPGAIVQGDSLEIPVQLLKGNRSKSEEEQLNQSYEGVEFQLASAIREIVQPEKKKIGLVVSHSKVPPSRLSDLIATLQLQYEVFLDLNEPGSYDGLDALMVLKPDDPFSEAEKFKFDQYLVKGGRALFFVDGARVDSVAPEGSFAQPMELNLGDLFFKWGIRVNQNLIKDMNCALIPLNVGNMGERAQIQPLPWRYYPLLNRFSDHVITRNLEAVYSRFLSSIDTLGGGPLVKTPLLMTSPYTRLVNAPVLVSFNEARQQPAPDEYQGGVHLAAVLVEGLFTSLYHNRILPSDPRYDGFAASGEGGKVIVAADGDLVVNDIDYQRQVPLPLGYDRITRNLFGNKDFVLLALDYLTDSEGLITARNKEIRIRLLDKIRIAEEKTFWQVINVLIPILLVGLCGGIGSWLHHRKFNNKSA